MHAFSRKSPSLRQSEMFVELAAAAERNIAERVRRVGPYMAEYVPGQELRWYVVRTNPGRENTAAAHLSARRFGIYIPELGVRWQQGRVITARPERMFSGLVLLLVSDIEGHKRRIEACPGVTGILRHASGKAVELADDDVQHFMGLEAVSLASGCGCGRTRRRKRRSAQELTPDNPDIPEGMVRMSCKSYWNALPMLDSEERNTLFSKALGLPVSSPITT